MLLAPIVVFTRGCALVGEVVRGSRCGRQIRCEQGIDIVASREENHLMPMTTHKARYL